MTGHIIIFILFIPIKAFILWIISILLTERQSYSIAFIAAGMTSIINSLYLVPINTAMMSYLVAYGCMIFGLIILKLLYRCEWGVVILMWMTLRFLRIPFSLIQNEILKLPWDSVMQAFN